MEHLTQRLIEGFSRNQLPAAELLSVTDHLAECESCRRRLEGAITGEAAFFALHDEAFSENGTASEHLTPQLLAEYVDKNLSGESLQMAEDHLSNCEECVFAVDDLRSFRNDIAPSLDREFRPAAVPPQTSQTKIGWREKFFSLFRTAPVPAFGSAALALLVLGVILWFVLRSPSEQEPQIAVAPTPSIQPSPFTQPSPAPTQIETAPVVAQLNDGGRVLTLDQQGNLSGADDLSPAHRSLVIKALSTQRIDKSPELQGLTRPPSSLMSSGDAKDKFSISGPVGDVLLTNQPTFRWTAMEGAKGYIVEVYDPQFNLVASSPQLTDLSWTTTLPRGNVYSWQVKAIQDAAEVTAPRPPAPQAKFRILDQAKANELARARRSLGSSHLTLGLLYAHAGLLSEAEREFRLLRNANPNSELARNLLRQVQALRKAQ